MENYNKQIRKKIVDDLETIMVKKYIPLKDAIMIYQQFLYNMLDNGNEYQKIFISYLIGLIYSDSYTVYSYKQKNNINEPVEIDTFSILHKLEDYDDLKGEISANPDVFCKMIQSTYQFNECSGLTKVLMVKSLSEKENEKITEIFPLHSENLTDYNKDIDLKSLIKNMNGQKKYYEKVMTISFADGIFIQTAGFIRKLAELDKNSAYKLLKEIVIEDYKICKYLITLLPEETKIKEHIEAYELLSADKIFEIMLNNQELLIDSLSNIFDLYINKSYGSINLSKELIEQVKNDDITRKLTMI